MTSHDRQADSARREIVRAGEADIGVLAGLIAEAFFPLTVCRWLIPDAATRRAAFPGYFQLYVEHAIEDGLVETTPDRAAAALWIPGTGPGAPPDSYTERLAAIAGPYLANFLAFDEELDRHHPAGSFHHHLAILAVRPDRQGQGIGTALLHAHHAVLADHGIPAYLEASDQRTRRIYLNHGYADQGSPIVLADGVRMYPMWRAPTVTSPPAAGEPRPVRSVPPAPDATTPASPASATASTDARPPGCPPTIPTPPSCTPSTTSTPTPAT
jgi:GNAT superfamily N-acetyltransferase